MESAGALLICGTCGYTVDLRDENHNCTKWLFRMRICIIWRGKRSKSGIVPGLREALPARATAEGSYAGRLHTAKTADQDGRGHLLDTQDRGRTGFRTNQTGARLPTVSLAWTDEGARGVGDHLSHAQHSGLRSSIPINHFGIPTSRGVILSSTRRWH